MDDDVVTVDGCLSQRIVYTEFFDVAAALLAELGDPLGPWTDEVVQLPHPTQWTSVATETRRTDGRRTLALERIEEWHFFDPQTRSSAGRIEGLPGGATLSWSGSDTGDVLSQYRVRGPATDVDRIDRAWSTACERYAAKKEAP